MPQDGRGDGLHELAMPLLITGTLEDYHARHGPLHAERLLHFLPWTRPTRRASIAAWARRGPAPMRCVGASPPTCGKTSTPPGWTFAISTSRLSHYGMSRFCEWVKERSHLFRGATYGTIMRNDAFRFIRLGTFIERADNTLRLLDARYEMAGEQAEAVSDGTAHAYYQWSALLRALSSFEAYTEIYRDAPGLGKWPSCCCYAPMCRVRCALAAKRSTRSSPACPASTAARPSAWPPRWMRACALPPSTKSSRKACMPG